MVTSQILKMVCRCAAKDRVSGINVQTFFFMAHGVTLALVLCDICGLASCGCPKEKL